MQIEYYVKHVYGVEREYPATEQMARIYHALTGEKTLRPNAKWALSALGHTFVEVLPPRGVDSGHQTTLKFPAYAA